jgi:N utilization substance protein B
MGTRREARECAVQFLFQYDLNPPDDIELALGQFWSTQRLLTWNEKKLGRAPSDDAQLPAPTMEHTAIRVFAEPLIHGVIEHRDAIDTLLRQHTQNWDLRRMAVVDRNILRLAVYEMLHRDDIPPVVSINEAVDIAKRFSTEDSGRFVNGILDKIKGELLRPARIVT